MEDDFDEDEEKDEDDRLAAGLEAGDHDKVYYFFILLIVFMDNIVLSFLS